MNQKQAKPPVILLIEPDNNVRPFLMANLYDWGYRVIVALNETDAVQRIKGGCEPLDLILLNQFERSLGNTTDLGRYICQSAELNRRAPIVVMAEQYGPELEGKMFKWVKTSMWPIWRMGNSLKIFCTHFAPFYEGQNPL